MIIERPICFFDLETTGTDKNNDRIVEISILKYFPDGPYEIKSKRVNPLMPIPKGASDVHGITNDDVRDCPSFKQLANNIWEYIKDCDIAGYNSNIFDVPFLYKEFYRSGVIWDYNQHHFIDVGNIFKRKEERTLSAAVKYYCGRDHENAHGAEADVIATMEVFQCQLNRYIDLPASITELAKYSNFDKDIVDLGGCFSRDSEGDYVFNFGKHKGKKCKDELSYLSWMSNQDFLPDAIAICSDILYSQGYTYNVK